MVARAREVVGRKVPAAPRRVAQGSDPCPELLRIFTVVVTGIHARTTA